MKVGVADDGPLVGRRLIRQIQSADDIVVIGEASEPDAVIQLVEQDPDVVVVDLSGRSQRIEITRAIVERLGSVGVVVLTDPDSADVAAEEIRAGAKGLLARGAPGPQLLETVRMVASGNVVIDAANWEATRGSGALPGGGLLRLSRREHQVLRQLARGRTNKQIAIELGVANETVKTHIDRIFRRLGVKNRTDAVAKAIRAGLVD